MFDPKKFFHNNHIQTLYPSLLKPSQPLEFDIERFSLSDGDFLECFWYKKDLSKPVVILLHGLGGSYKSPYIPSLVKALYTAHFSPVVMHFRGAAHHPNNKARSYHSGDTGDISEFIDHLSQYTQELYGVGFSLGANVLLKYLAEFSVTTPLKKAVAVSTPFLLDVASDQINKGFSKFYQWYLLKDLKKMLLYKQQKFSINLTQQQIKKIKTFREFDELYTAPIHGFKDADDYYKRSSSYYTIDKITTPTLLIHAKDDPFMRPDVVPNTTQLPHSVTLELSDHGGHVGFVSGSVVKPIYYLDWRIVEFLKEE